MMPPEQEIIIRFITLFVAISAVVVIIHGLIHRVTQFQRVLLGLLWLVPLIIFEIIQIWEIVFPPNLLIPSSAIHYISAAIKLGAALVISVYGTLFLIEKHVRDKERV